MCCATTTPPFSVVSTGRARPGSVLPTGRSAARGIGLAAVFAADGESFIEPGQAVHAILGTSPDLTALGAEKLAREASLDGFARGAIAAGRVTLRRLGAGTTMGLLLTQPANVPTAAVGELHQRAAQADADRRAAAPPRPKPTTSAAPCPALSGRWTPTALPSKSEPFAQWSAQEPQRCSGRLGPEIPAALEPNSKGEMARALASQNTWSGIVVPWPVDDASRAGCRSRCGLPVYDRERRFAGYRGFGICRDVERLAAQPAPSAPSRTPSAHGTAGGGGDHRTALTSGAANVLPFPAPKSPEPVLAP